MAVGCSKQEAEEPAAAEHEGTHGPHDGVVSRFTDGSGYVELKLHDDKGDLELWLAADKAISTPLALPLDAHVKVSFPELEGREVSLAVRNTEHNEDEQGTPNIVDGKTHYFIFPGETGADASWLKGKGFASQAVVTIVREGRDVVSEPFTLLPHHH